MVSLIITTYNYAQYIERAIRSALDQSLSKTDFEIIVVNDASTDATEIILDNRVVIDLVVEKLLDAETIDGEEFREIVSNYTILPSKK